jgi:hypothetical protein
VRRTLIYLIAHRLPGGNYPSSAGEARRDRLVQWCHGAAGVALVMVKAYEVFSQRAFLDAARQACEVVWERGLLRKLSLCHGVAGNLYAFLALRRAEALAAQRGHGGAGVGGGGQPTQQAPSLHSSGAVNASTDDGSLAVSGGKASAADGDVPLQRARAFAAFLLSGTTATTGLGGGGKTSTTAAAGDGAHWQHLVAAGEMHGGDRPESLFEGAAGVAYALEDVLEPDAAGFPGFELRRR